MPVRKPHPQQRQFAFLRALEANPFTLEELIADQHVGRAELARWLTSKRFRKHLDRRLDGVRRLGSVQRVLGTRRALDRLMTLIAATGKTPSDAQRRACVDVLKLGPAPRKTTPRAKPHPSVAPDRAAVLLDLMRRDEA